MRVAMRMRLALALCNMNLATAMRYVAVDVSNIHLEPNTEDKGICKPKLEGIEREIASLQLESYIATNDVRRRNLLRRLRRQQKLEMRQQAATRILARQLVRLRQQITKLQGSRAQIRGVATHTQAMYASTAISSGVKGATKAMVAMNKKMAPAKQAKVVREFQKQSTQMDMTTNDGEENAKETSARRAIKNGRRASNLLMESNKELTESTKMMSKQLEAMLAKLRILASYDGDERFADAIKDEVEVERRRLSKSREKLISMSYIHNSRSSLKIETVFLETDTDLLSVPCGCCKFIFTVFNNFPISSFAVGCFKFIFTVFNNCPISFFAVLQIEMLSDSIDETLDKDEAEEETEELTNQVLDEIGVDIASQLSSAPKGRISSKKVENTSTRSESPDVVDLEKRLASLRRL
ncbi:hypothetical protein GIB67_034848 [Kingdonia uniflora]|uniref:SNF7 family protein n=1 Tax=Kingdonia uniflora TaxID=39325 RepID=A0A7J7ME07_9MAGN|nr:hypothetical protein GIB67_034848 [Kingdonia uniflora]